MIGVYQIERVFAEKLQRVGHFKVFLTGAECFSHVFKQEASFDGCPRFRLVA